MPDDDEVATILAVWSWIDVTTYGFVLGFALFNSTKFLIIEKRYSCFYLTSFYLLTIFVATDRITHFFSSYKMLMAETFDPVWWKNIRIYYFTSALGGATKAALGVF